MPAADARAVPGVAPGLSGPRTGAYCAAVHPSRTRKRAQRYLFGVNSQQAQLDLAYGYFKNDESVSALAACDRFMKLYPDNRHADYAY